MFLAGGVALLGWLYLTTSNPESGRLLRKSAGLFGVPILLFAAIPLERLDFIPGTWLFLLLGMAAMTLLAECLKAWAGRTEDDPFNRFWLVASFGVWELMLARPLLGLRHEAVLAGSDRLEIFGLLMLAAAPLLMHAVTAAVYAFGRASRPLQLMLCWTLHLVYVETVAAGFVAALTWCVALVIALAALWPGAAPESPAPERTA